MSKVRVVIPSLLGDVEHLKTMCDAASKGGASPVVVANSRRLCEQLSGSGIPFITSRHNDGFAASIALGANGEWDWLVILNDDIRFDSEDLALCLSASCLESLDPAAVIHFDDEPPRKIPSRAGVLLNVSLLANIGRKLSRRFQSGAPAPEDAYRSFSAVAIARGAWESLGGLDLRFPFAYEDADFIRRALNLRMEVTSIRTSIVHLHSQTGGRFVTAVLPVATWSALEYLSKWYGRRNLHRSLLLIALFLRIPVAVLTSRRPRIQLQAIANTMSAVFRDRPPSLPAWGLV